MPMKSRRSYVWQFYTEKKLKGSEEDASSVKIPHCDICGAVVPKTGSNTSGLRHHLQTVHKKHDPSKRGLEYESDDSEDDEAPGTSSTSSTPGKRLKSQLKKMRQKALDLERHKKTLGEWFLIMLVESGMNCHQISKCRFTEAATHFMGHKHVRCHKTVKKQAFEVIDKMIANCKAELAAEKAAGVKMSVQVDEWTSSVARMYMSVIVTTSNKTYNLGLAKCIGSIDSTKTVEIVKKRLEEFGLDLAEMTSLTSDGA